jgi:hypothetical protein
MILLQRLSYVISRAEVPEPPCLLSVLQQSRNKTFVHLCAYMCVCKYVCTYVWKSLNLLACSLPCNHPEIRPSSTCVHVCVCKYVWYIRLGVPEPIHIVLIYLCIHVSSAHQRRSCMYTYAYMFVCVCVYIYIYIYIYNII